VTPLLQLRNVKRDFGSLCAVDNVSFSVRSGARHALIGPNGAGKSTLFNLVGGSLSVSSGVIVFDGKDITGEPEHARARLGIARTFQHSSVFLHGTLVENVLVGVARQAGVGASWFGAALHRRALVDRCIRLLDLVGLQNRYTMPAGALSHGERRQLELAMALGTEPRLLLLDEPAAGMSQAETARFTELIAGLPPDVTVLLIEHDLDVVFELADTVTVLHLGGHLATGSPEEIRGDSEVQRAYLGAAVLEDLFETAGSDS
jgi:branched-chain amino acid transport system ATP-binding protein